MQLPSTPCSPLRKCGQRRFATSSQGEQGVEGNYTSSTAPNLIIVLSCREEKVRRHV